MEKKLWWIITTPAMVLTVFFGSWMLVTNPDLLKQPWMHVKLCFVLVLLAYHFVSQRWMFQLHRGIFSYSSSRLRLWNELATLCLVAIVFLAVTKGTISWWKATLSFFAVAVALMVLIKIYKRITSQK